jgi:hypothetical protein
MPSEKIPASVRRVVALRAKNYCEYCLSPENIGTQSFTVEHIKPRQAGGETILENLAWSCFGCNSHKHTKVAAIDPETGVQVSLFNPRQQLWAEHFGWSGDFTIIIGKTAEGRATVKALILNREGVVNLRRVLVLANLHPPSL